MPRHQRTETPPAGLLALIRTVVCFDDREIINKCGLDAYFFLRYLKILLFIFVPICFIVLPTLIPVNLVGGIGHDVASGAGSGRKNTTSVTGLDTLAWRNVRPDQTARYGAHLCMAILVVLWVCSVFFVELRKYIKVRQDYLTGAQHRLRASASTILIRSIPRKWLDEAALRGLLDVFPGGVRKVWLNRDMTQLMRKVCFRNHVHAMLERAETELIKAANEQFRKHCKEGPRGITAAAEPDSERKGARDAVDSTKVDKPQSGNAPKSVTIPKALYDKARRRFLQFWEPPAGGGRSPVPQAERKVMPAAGPWKFWGAARGKRFYDGVLPKCTTEYPSAHESGFNLAVQSRPTHRMGLFGSVWLPGLPLLHKKVDTIHWCRWELARLNVEIEKDQMNLERFPLVSSAFVQFEQQIAAHMACQGVLHHVPRCMATEGETSPRDVLWENMALSWWQEWLRSVLVTVVACSMVVLWAIPIAWTAVLGQADRLMKTEWLSFLAENSTVERFIKAAAGILPAAVLGLLLYLVPHILSVLARVKGARTGTQQTEFVQTFYFAFLFVQVFLVVSITSFFAASFSEFMDNVAELDSSAAILDLLAWNLPQASNYFFSYMILQGLATSSGTLLQVGGLVSHFIVRHLKCDTPRSEWENDTNVTTVCWGSFFPIYTNFACIALVYCVISPLISVFAVITFSLLWWSQRYAMLYVYHFEADTGGVLFPRAINQTFTGLYFMELCVAGLFFVVEDDNAGRPCRPHGVAMIVVFALTIVYQVMLNRSFSPLFRYLPITFEDEAVLKDREFRQQQSTKGHGMATPIHGVAGHRATRDVAVSATQKDICVSTVDENQRPNAPAVPCEGTGGYRCYDRHEDTLLGGLRSSLAELCQPCQDELRDHAFLHPAVLAKQPTVWIPKDDLGLSREEIYYTEKGTNHIPITDHGANLERGKVRIKTYPPDFSPSDMVAL